MWAAIFEGVQSAYAAQRQLLATMTPEQRAAQRARRAQESCLVLSREIQAAIAAERQAAIARLEAAPEVMLARQYIADEALHGEHADRLLTFARDLATRRGTAS